MASMRRHTGPQPSASTLALRRRRIMSGALSDLSQEEDEVHLLRQLTSGVRCAQQSTPFSDLPPELRNRIYEEVIPRQSYDDALIVASRNNDALMAKAVQPAITRVSKQTRAESLGLFYARSTFAAYIEETDFTALIDWVRAITSETEGLPAITVYVYLMDRVACEFSILDLIQSWTRLPSFAHEKIHLRFLQGPSYQIQWDVSINQRVVVAAAISFAEELAAKGIREEASIARYCKRLLEKHRVRLIGCDGLETSMISGWQYKHAAGRRCKFVGLSNE